uniref:Nucleotid_trans domain-containing protein n=1 Tax=Steinernema glaseri TaxID=37863 RepID=A0A1I7ZMA7_9BILA
MTKCASPLIADLSGKRSPSTKSMLSAIRNRRSLIIAMVLGLALLLFAFFSFPFIDFELYSTYDANIPNASVFFDKYDLDSLHGDIGTVTINDLVIVSAFSRNHASEMRALEGVPYRLVIYRMIDVDEDETNLMRRHCPKQVEFRIFDFDEYPAYVRNLKEYRWKHLIIAQLLMEGPLVFWVDSSVRFYDDPRQSIQTVIDYAKRPESLNVVQLCDTGHKIFPVTIKEMFVRFCYPEEQAKKLNMFAGGVTLWIRSPRTVKILKEMVSCSLEKECMAPKGARLRCDSAVISMGNKFAGCHRFDQSALAVVLSKEANFDLSRYAYTGGELTFLKVERGT